MTDVLDEAECQLGREFTVYWVDGSGEPFALLDLVPPVVTFCSRTVERFALLRKLISERAIEGDLLTDAAEATILSLIAEFGLERGNPDHAVLAFARSVTVSWVHLMPGDLPSLEYEPFSSAYMAVWFYALCHELGHLVDERPQTGMFSREWIMAAFDNEAASRDWIQEEAAQAALDQLKQDPERFGLGSSDIAIECQADVFATAVLFKATSDILAEAGDRFEVVAFVNEAILALNAVSLLERCARMGVAAGNQLADDILIATIFEPLAVAVRARIQQEYLRAAVEAYLTPAEGSSDELTNTISRFFEETNAGLQTRFVAIENGLTRAVTFMLDDDGRDNDYQVLEALRQELSGPARSFPQFALRRFLALPRREKMQSKLFSALERMAEDPSIPLDDALRDESVYILPFVKGPDGYLQPFSLDTKYGSIAFVFWAGDERFDKFFEISSEGLKPGYALERTIVLASKPTEVGAAIAERLELDRRVGFVVEGTDAFDQLFEELVAETIWE